MENKIYAHVGVGLLGRLRKCCIDPSQNKTVLLKRIGYFSEVKLINDIATADIQISGVCLAKPTYKKQVTDDLLQIACLFAIYIELYLNRHSRVYPVPRLNVFPYHPRVDQ